MAKTANAVKRFRASGKVQRNMISLLESEGYARSLVPHSRAVTRLASPHAGHLNSSTGTAFPATISDPHPSIMAQRPYFEILDQADTPLGLLCLRRRAVLSRPGTFVTEICVGHELLMSSYHIESEQVLARRALEWHGGKDLRVVVGGLGLGYTAEAALATGQVESLEVFELIPAVIRWLQEGFVPLSESLSGDSRLRIVQGDIFAALGVPREESPREESPVDAILIDIDHSPDKPLAAPHQNFYTVDGLRRASRWLAPDGVLAVWSSSPNPAFSKTLTEAFAQTEIENVEWSNDFTDTEEVDHIFMARHPCDANASHNPSPDAPPS